MSKLRRFCHIIDIINDWAGQIFAWLLVPMFLIATYEVAARYVFNNPTVWAWEINAWLMAAVTVLLGGYILLKGAHVNIDVFTSHMSPRARAIVDMITSLLFFLSMGLLLWLSTTQAVSSFLSKEVSGTIFKGPIYIVKMLFPIGAFLLLLQGIAKFIRDLSIAIKPNEGGK